jgi:hypothetical protein
MIGMLFGAASKPASTDAGFADPSSYQRASSTSRRLSFKKRHMIRTCRLVVYDAAISLEIFSLSSNDTSRKRRQKKNSMGIRFTTSTQCLTMVDRLLLEQEQVESVRSSFLSLMGPVRPKLTPGPCHVSYIISSLNEICIPICTEPVCQMNITSIFVRLPQWTAISPFCYFV